MIERGHLDAWRYCSPLPDKDKLDLSGNALRVYDALNRWGASFFQELMSETGLLKTQLEEALGVLVAAGLVTSDSFQGLRTLVMPQKILHRRSKRYPFHDPLAAAGRWSLLRPLRFKPEDSYQPVEHIARTLLLRYGVIFRKLLDNEENLPTWRELLYIYRRLEARGELRGGRFVQGFAGEQFALPEALSALRDVRKQPKTGELTVINCADPLNLSGIITPGERIPSISGQRMIYRDGVPLAFGQRDKVTYLESMDAEHQWRLQWALMGK